MLSLLFSNKSAYNLMLVVRYKKNFQACVWCFAFEWILTFFALGFTFTNFTLKDTGSNFILRGLYTWKCCHYHPFETLHGIFCDPPVYFNFRKFFYNLHSWILQQYYVALPCVPVSVLYLCIPPHKVCNPKHWLLHVDSILLDSW